jgi:hypothetical protein
MDFAVAHHDVLVGEVGDRPGSKHAGGFDAIVAVVVDFAAGY